MNLLEHARKRLELTVQYHEICKKIGRYEGAVTTNNLTRWQRIELANLLEKQSALDMELYEILLEARDYRGIEKLNENSKLLADVLWDLKKDLNSAELKIAEIME